MTQERNETSGRGSARATVLVVEDDPTINQALTDRLLSEGFTVIQAFDGPGAVEAHGEQHIDLVDYLTKPFRMREVVARVRALLRRVDRARELATALPGPLTVGEIVIDRGAHRVVVAGDPVRLTPLEFDLLLALADEPGTVRGRDQLMREVWGWADASGTRTLDSHVKALRAKIGPHRVRTVHGVGYALDAGGRSR